MGYLFRNKQAKRGQRNLGFWQSLFFPFLLFLQWGLFELGEILVAGVYILRLGSGDLDFHQAGKVQGSRLSDSLNSRKSKKVKSRWLLSRAYHGTQTVTDSRLRHMIGTVDFISTIDGYISLSVRKDEESIDKGSIVFRDLLLSRR